MHRFRILSLLAAFCFVSIAIVGATGPKTTPKAPKVQAQAGKSTTRAQKAKARGAGAEKSTGRRIEKSHESRRAETADSATIAAKIARNPKLKARIESMLPTGMTLDQAADGFRNQGQFIAAVNASKNHGISFTQLKNEMTGDNALSLGDAIQKLKPAATTGSK